MIANEDNFIPMRAIDIPRVKSFLAKMQADIDEAESKDKYEEAIHLLYSVHNWFMKQAPEHYNGCGLWIDVDDFLKQELPEIYDP